MAKIDNITSTLVNFVILPQTRFEPSLVNSQDIKTKMVEVYGDSSKPTLTQFPDLFLMFDPVNQINLSVEGERIVITDNRVSDYNQRDLNNFIQFSKASSDMISKIAPLSAFGFNIIAIADTDIEDSGQFLSEKFINHSALEDRLKVTSAGLRFIYNDQGLRSELKLDPIFSSFINPDKTNSIQVSLNTHFIMSDIPPLSEFSDQITKAYTQLPILLSQIL